jgi:Anti-sigma-K factor rskA
MDGSEDDRIAYLAGEPVDALTAQERAELDELADLLAAEAIWEQPDPALEDRVVAAIAQEARQGARSSDPAPAPAPRRRPLFRRPAFAFGGLAAVTAAVVAIAIAVSSPAPAPTQFAMVVSGTNLAPGAQGSATLTKTASGWRIELSANGLPHLTNGRYYEAWLKNAAGVLVPIGTFNDAREVTLWAGVPPTEYPALSVTRQKASGNPASSGERVLTGTITAKH